MKSKTKYLYLVIIAIHVILIAVAFNSFVSNPSEVLFANDGDGLKNAFTLKTYVQEPITKDGLFKYNSLNYPFGDYVYYTDNTPLVSIPLRWFSHNVYDVSDYSLQILNWIVLLNIVLAGVLVFSISRRLIKDKWLSFILAIILPWINLQVFRIWHGHINLSLSAPILMAIYLFMLWDEYKGLVRKQIRVSISMVMLGLVGFFIHGYYLAIVFAFLSSMLFFYGITDWRGKSGRLSIIVSLLLPIVSGGIVYAILGLTDKYAHLRFNMSTGYDWMEMKARFTSLFSAPEFYSLHFPVSSMHYIHTENVSYLGNISLYTIFLLVVAFIASKIWRKRIKVVQSKFFKNSRNRSLLIASFILLAMAMGEDYYTSETIDAIHFKNVFNPFFYIHFCTDYVEQFRALVRFMWPVYFGIFLWTVYTLYHVSMFFGRKGYAVLLVVISVIGGLEMRDFINELQHKARKENVLSDSRLSPYDSLKINAGKYQAILPLPYYNVGSEDKDRTMDDFVGWGDETYRLSLYTNLPLMSNKLSRTPQDFAIAHFALIARDSMLDIMYDRLNTKPVLVMVHEKLILDTNFIKRFSKPVQEYNQEINKFVERKGLTPIDSLGDVKYYEWYPKR